MKLEMRFTADNEKTALAILYHLTMAGVSGLTLVGKNVLTMEIDAHNAGLAGSLFLHVDRACKQYAPQDLEQEERKRFKRSEERYEL